MKIKIVGKEFDVTEDEVINTLDIELTGMEDSDYSYMVLGSGRTRNKIYEDGFHDLYFAGDEDPIVILWENSKEYGFEIEGYTFKEKPIYIVWHTEMDIFVRTFDNELSAIKFVKKFEHFLEIRTEFKLASYLKRG
jgi:hypothetical protein